MSPKIQTLSTTLVKNMTSVSLETTNINDYHLFNSQLQL